MNTYNLTGEYGIGYTTKGEEFYFDFEDYDNIKQYNWYIDSNGYVSKSNPYIRMHRLVMNLFNPNIMIDHIYHKKNDNRKSQLRIVTNRQNQMNKDISSQNSTR